MKIRKQQISEKDGEGSVTLVAEEPEDMWHLYNLVMSGDELRASTYRKVVSTSSTGTTRSDKKKITLTLAMVSAWSGFGQLLRAPLVTLCLGAQNESGAP